MTQIISPTSIERSRLVTLLTELSTSRLSSADHNLAERLGHLIGMSGSINLAKVLRQPARTQNAFINTAAENLQQDVLAARERMMRGISASFEQEAGESQNKVPTANVAVRPQVLLTYAPYKRFYSTYQVEIAVEVQRLRAMTRKGLSGVSTELSQLAELDKTFEENLTSHNRTLFNVMPKLLEERFKLLLNAYQEQLQASGINSTDKNEIEEDFSEWLKPGAWLDLLYRDLRELLLAEFDVRLQPVFGLLEALNEHTNKQ